MKKIDRYEQNPLPHKGAAGAARLSYKYLKRRIVSE